MAVSSNGIHDTYQRPWISTQGTAGRLLQARLRVTRLEHDGRRETRDGRCAHFGRADSGEISAGKTLLGVEYQEGLCAVCRVDVRGRGQVINRLLRRERSCSPQRSLSGGERGG